MMSKTYTTQMDAARKGIVTPQMETVAKKEEVPYNEFNTLIRESESIEGGEPNGTDLSPQGGLPVSEPGADGRTRADREIRAAAEDIPEGTQEEPVPEPADQRETGQPSGRDRADGTGTNGEPDGRAADEVSGPGQRDGSDGMDSAYEQPESPWNS